MAPTLLTMELFYFVWKELWKNFFFIAFVLKIFFGSVNWKCKKKIMIEFTAILCFLSEKKKLYDE
jgi:hypothetical protein